MHYCVKRHRICPVLDLKTRSQRKESTKGALDKPVSLTAAPPAFALDTVRCFGHPTHVRC